MGGRVTIREWFRRLFGGDDSRADDLEREAADELHLDGTGERSPSTPAAPPQVGWATAPASSQEGLTPPEEREAVTDFAREQLAARHGAEVEHVGLQVDPESAAAKRDRALERYLERKERLDREREERRRRRERREADEPEPSAGETDGLDAVGGIGPAKRDALLERFGSAEAVARADPDELTEVPGIGEALAEKLRDALG